MDELTDCIEGMRDILSGIGPSTLTPQNLDEAMRGLLSIDFDGCMERFAAGLPARPEDEEAAEAHDDRMGRLSDDINRSLGGANAELARLKELRTTLNLEALDPMVETAREAVRRLYGLTASLQG